MRPYFDSWAGHGGDPLVRRDVACNVSVWIVSGCVGDVARYVSTGWVWDVFFIETIAIVEIVGCPLRRKLTDKIGGNNDCDKAGASNVKINVIREIIK